MKCFTDFFCSKDGEQSLPRKKYPDQILIGFFDQFAQKFDLSQAMVVSTLMSIFYLFLSLLRPLCILRHGPNPMNSLQACKYKSFKVTHSHLSSQAQSAHACQLMFIVSKILE